MSEQMVVKFIDGLWKLESTRDIDTITHCFADNCELGNIVGHGHFKGPDGVRHFWNKYRDAFGDVRSTFRNIIISGSTAALEWTTEGKSLDGNPINYSGVSVLEMSDEGIVRFQAYFDAEELGRQMSGAKTKKLATSI